MRLRVLSQTKTALGGDVTLSIVSDISDIDADLMFGKLWHTIYVFERQFSRFLPMSELSVFNRTTGLEIPTSIDFKKLLECAKAFGLETDGLYNPFILPALQQAGYKNSAVPGYEHDKQIDYSGRRVVSVDQLIIGDNWAQIPYGTAIDLGGCGKGYLADQLGDILNDYPVVGYWLSLGGDVATLGQDENGNQITIGIQDASNLESSADWSVVSPITRSAVATSGTYRRKGQQSKNDWHHIIDPTSLQPAITDVRLATVCADTALRADVLASCAVILGSQKAPAFLKKHKAIAALLQCIDENGVVFEKVFGDQIAKQHVYQTKGVM